VSDAGAGTARAPAPSPWQVGRVSARRPEHAACVSLRLALGDWVAHLPGQHYDVRLTAPDGYVAQRSYSVASAPEDMGEIELTIDRLPDGEVSPYLCDEVRVGDEIEVRGPIGGYFAWRGESPALLVGGGSGVVPLMAMLRHRRRADPHADLRLAASFRSPDVVLYRDELGPETVVTYTRDFPDGWMGARGRVSRVLLEPLARPDGLAFVCGSNGFVETAVAVLLDLGYDAASVRTERFGPTG
jgi:ferredoxin-NADP reductase